MFAHPMEDGLVTMALAVSVVWWQRAVLTRRLVSGRAQLVRRPGRAPATNSAPHRLAGSRSASPSTPADDLIADG